MWVITLPIALLLSKNKRYPLNLNHYRNAHFRENHKAKELFEQIVTPLVLHLPRFDEVELQYTLYPLRQCDVANICCIVDKFFSDVLVKTGRIVDDNSSIVKRVSYSIGSMDKTRPRVEVQIMTSESKTMQITLVQREIETAITNFINNTMRINDGKKVIIDLAATRGASGFTATIDIVDAAEVTSQVAEVKQVTANGNIKVEPEIEDITEEADAPVTTAANTPSQSLFDGLN